MPDLEDRDPKAEDKAPEEFEVIAHSDDDDDEELNAGCQFNGVHQL